MLRKGAFTTKSFERSRIFGFGLPEDILSKGEKPREGGAGGLKKRKKRKIIILS